MLASLISSALMLKPNAQPTRPPRASQNAAFHILLIIAPIITVCGDVVRTVNSDAQHNNHQHYEADNKLCYMCVCHKVIVGHESSKSK